ncbi:hypothetical protein M1D80_16905 [Phyllobacteriaceae bacterium JZ32]
MHRSEVACGILSFVRPYLLPLWGAGRALSEPAKKAFNEAYNEGARNGTEDNSCQRRIPNAYAMPTRAAKYAICTRTPSKAISCKATSITVPTATEIKPYKAFALASFALIAPPNKAPICWTKMAIEMAFLSHLILLAYYTQD